MNFHIEDFTEKNFKQLVELAKQKYKFITYDEVKNSGENVVLWRHDVDFSMHRALKLARIEAEANVVCTYFLYPHSTMYNLLEDEVSKIVKDIIKLGHKIGLHFEPAHYRLYFEEIDRFKKYLQIEKNLLVDLFETDVNVFSFHNPDVGGWVEFEEFDVCGMVNTYSKFLKDNFFYCSDSNGYWRFKRLEDVLRGDEKRLHILLHPEWWVPNEMSARDRINRCIDGRSKKCNSLYDQAIKKMGRLNVT